MGLSISRSTAVCRITGEALIGTTLTCHIVATLQCESTGEEKSPNPDLFALVPSSLSLLGGKEREEATNFFLPDRKTNIFSSASSNFPPGKRPVRLLPPCFSLAILFLIGLPAAVLESSGCVCTTFGSRRRRTRRKNVNTQKRFFSDDVSRRKLLLLKGAGGRLEEKGEGASQIDS